MMTRGHIIAGAVVLLAALLLSFMIHHWSRDPRELVLGEWRDAQRMGTVRVEHELAFWEGVGGRKTIPYRWVQAEKEPYELEFRYRGESLRTELRFSGDDEVILRPRIMEKLPPIARRMLCEQNRAHGRPEDEFNILFRRVKPKK